MLVRNLWMPSGLTVWSLSWQQYILAFYFLWFWDYVLTFEEEVCSFPESDCITLSRIRSFNTLGKARSLGYLSCSSW